MRLSGVGGRARRVRSQAGGRCPHAMPLLRAAPRPYRWLARMALAIAAPLSVASACGGAAPTPQVEPQAPSSLEQATAAFERHESELEGLLAAHERRGDREPTDGPQPLRTEPPAPEAPADTPPPARRVEPAGDRCEVACRALGSMLRAVEQICVLAGPADSRCVDVRARARRAEDLVLDLCPACAPL